MIYRTDEVDVVDAISIDPRVCEVNIAIKSSAGTIGLDGRLVVKDAQEIWSGRTASDTLSSEEALAIVESVSVLTVRIVESRHPLVAEGLYRSSWIATTLSTHENTPVIVPGDDWITR